MNAAFSFCVAVLLLVGLVRADDAKDMEGTWQVESMERGGVKAPQESLKEKTVVIKDGKITRHKDQTTSIKIDSSKDPKQVDVGDGDKAELGIYKFESGKLYFCFEVGGNSRPKEFSSTAGSDTMLVVLKKD